MTTYQIMIHHHPINEKGPLDNVPNVHRKHDPNTHVYVKLLKAITVKVKKPRARKVVKHMGVKVRKVSLKAMRAKVRRVTLKAMVVKVRRVILKAMVAKVRRATLKVTKAKAGRVTLKATKAKARAKAKAKVTVPQAVQQIAKVAHTVKKDRKVEKCPCIPWTQIKVMKNLIGAAEAVTRRRVATRKRAMKVRIPRRSKPFTSTMMIITN